MKKAAQKTQSKKKTPGKSQASSKPQAKSPLYLRYEFSDETGELEGGDIFQFSSLLNLKKMMSEVLNVAQSDGVTVSFTIGQDDNFFHFLKNTGLSQKEVEQEMVDEGVVPFLADSKDSKPKRSPKKLAKSAKKSA
jgi:hypothetical protein